MYYLISTYMNKKFISIKDAARILGITKLTLRNWDRAGKLVPTRNPMNNYRMYQRDSVEELVKLIESGDLLAIKKYRNSKPRKVKIVQLED
jgi:DNA-binding transcriptional MerR regulator